MMHRDQIEHIHLAMTRAAKRKTIAVWFSCGAASAVAAKETIRKYGRTHNVRIVNNPVAEEHPDNLRFLEDVQRWIRHPIEFATHSKYPDARCVDVWTDRRFMGGHHGAPCTMILKKQARQQWESRNDVDFHVLGFTADEQARHDRFVLSERDNVIPVLIDEGLTKQDCMNVLIEAGLKPPEMYALGYPNANCIGCVKATSPTYWNHVRFTHPDVFEERATLSRNIDAKLVRVKGERIFLDELSPDAVGQPMKSMTLDCGTFCEEPT